jgi:hypothetical protein
VSVANYFVGEGDAHRVDHPPLFACREHKQILRFSERFVDELLATSQDVMPGNPDEIVGSFLPPAAPSFRLPEFLIPPKVVLYNPRNLAGAEAVPYVTALVDKKFFGIPARYLTPDRFDGCEQCKERLREARARRQAGTGPAARPAGAPPPNGPAASGVRRGPPGAPAPAPKPRPPRPE